MDLDTFYVKTTFYVRPEQTLALATVGRRVGGPGSGLWGCGWRLGTGGRALADVALPDVAYTLSRVFVEGRDVWRMDPSARAAWMRTWQGPGLLR